jgi:AcrR family transcriptional regulator
MPVLEGPAPSTRTVHSALSMGTRTATPRLPRALRRDSILASAARAFAGAGFTATSVAEIAGAAGVTPIILYRHFDSKADLYRAVLSNVATRLRAQLASTSATEGYGLGARPLLEVARDDPDGFRLLWRHATREPQFAVVAEALRTEAIASARATLDGLVAPELLDWAAHAVLGYLVAAILAWLDHGDPERDEQLVVAIDRSLRAGVRAWSEVSGSS